MKMFSNLFEKKLFPESAPNNKNKCVLKKKNVRKKFSLMHKTIKNIVRICR